MNFSIIGFLLVKFLAFRPPEQDPEVLGYHSSVAGTIASNAAIDGLAGDAFFFGDVIHRMASQDFFPGGPLDGIQVDVESFLFPQFGLLFFRFAFRLEVRELFNA